MDLTGRAAVRCTLSDMLYSTLQCMCCFAIQAYPVADSHLQLQGIHLTAYSPLGTPDSAAMQNRGDQTPHLMSDPAVKKIADKHGKHTAPVSLLMLHTHFVLWSFVALEASACGFCNSLCSTQSEGARAHCPTSTLHMFDSAPADSKCSLLTLNTEG